MVSNALSIDDNTSVDIHGMANFFLKSCTLNVSLSLIIIFNKSLSSGTFPNDWKLSQITPIHKSGYKVDILFSNFIHKNFSNRLQTDVIFTDFAKTFDEVDHPTLLAKLNILSIKSTILNWMPSYL